MSELLSDEHVAAVNGAVEQMLGHRKHILVINGENITMGEILCGFYRRYKEFGEHHSTDPWKVNYSKAGKRIADREIYDVIVSAMDVAISRTFLGQQLLRKVMDDKEFHHTEWAERGYFINTRTPNWIMTDAGRVFYETLALPPPLPRRNKPLADSGAMAPTAVA